MVFSPFLINSEVQEGLTFAKQAKLKSTNYLFSDIINVFINQEQNNNSFPTLLKSQQTETPISDINSLLQQNNIDTVNLTFENLENIKLASLESVKLDLNNNKAQAQTTVNLIEILKSLLGNANSEAKNVDEKINGKSTVSNSGTDIQTGNKELVKSLNSGESILLKLNTEEGLKSFIISANELKNTSTNSNNIKNEIKLNVSEVDASSEEIELVTTAFKKDNKEYSLVDKSNNLLGQLSVLSIPNSVSADTELINNQNVKAIKENNEVTVAGNKANMSFSSNNYYLHNIVNYETDTNNEITIPLDANESFEGVNGLKLVKVVNPDVSPKESFPIKTKTVIAESTVQENKSAETSATKEIITEIQKAANNSSNDLLGVKGNSENKINVTEIAHLDEKNTTTAAHPVKIRFDESKVEKTSVKGEIKAEAKINLNNSKSANNPVTVDKNTEVKLPQEVKLETSESNSIQSAKTIYSEDQVIVNKNIEAVHAKTGLVNENKSSLNEVKQTQSYNSETIATKTIISENAEINEVNAAELNDETSITKKELNQNDVKGLGKANSGIEEVKNIKVSSGEKVDQNIASVKENTTSKTVLKEINSAINKEAQNIISNKVENEKPIEKPQVVSQTDNKNTKLDYSKNTIESEILTSKVKVQNNSINTEVKEIPSSAPKEINPKEFISNSAAEKSFNTKVESPAKETNKQNLEQPFVKTEKQDHEPISIKVKKNVKDVNYIKTELVKEEIKSSTKTKIEVGFEAKTNQSDKPNDLIKTALKPELSENPVKIKSEAQAVETNQIVKPKNNEVTAKLNKTVSELEISASDKKNIRTENHSDSKEIVKESTKDLTMQAKVSEKEIPKTVINKEVSAHSENNRVKENTVDKNIIQNSSVKLDDNKNSESKAQTDSPKVIKTEIQSTTDSRKLDKQEKVLNKEHLKENTKEPVKVVFTDKVEKEEKASAPQSNSQKDHVVESGLKEKTVSNSKSIDNSATENVSQKVEKNAVKVENETVVVKEASVKTDNTKTEKPNNLDKENTTEIKSSENEKSSSQNHSKEDLSKNDQYKSVDNKDVKTELRDKSETRFEKELVNSRDETSRKIDSEFKTEAARNSSNAERLVKTAEIMKEVAKHIQSKEKNSLILQIDPENLGKMKIKLEMIENSIRAKIEVESHVVRQHLENNLNDLYSQLSKNGVQLNGVNITLSEPDLKSGKQFSGKKKGSGNNLKDEEIEITEDLKTKSLGYNTYDYVV